MNNFLAGLVSWVLVPVAVSKGLGVRRAVPRLPPPRGRPRGQSGEGDAGIRILIVGDSSAAGVGADRVEETLGPQVAAFLGEATGKAVA